MTDYTKTVDFAAKDALASGDPNKKAKGTEVDTELNNIAVASATKANKVTGATVGHVAKFKAGGDLETTGLATPTGTFVGTTDTQTLTNKTLTTPTITLKQGSAPTPTAEGDIQWDTDDNLIIVGDGSGQKIFYPAGADTSYAAAGSGVTNGDSHDHSGGDGATIPISGGGSGSTTKNGAREAFGIYHGRIDYDATTIRLPSGWSAATSADDLVVTHNLGTTNYSVVVMGVDTSGSTLEVNCNNIGTNTFTIEINTTLAAQHEFHFVLIED